MGLLGVAASLDSSTRWSSGMSAVAVRDLWGASPELPLTSRELQRREWLHKTLDLMDGGPRFKFRARPAWRTPRGETTGGELQQKKRKVRKVRKQESIAEITVASTYSKSNKPIVLLSHIIILFKRLLKEQAKKSEKLLQRLESMDILSSSDERTNQLLFDKNYFKRLRDAPIKTKARKILERDPEGRDAEELAYLRSTLLTYDSIAGYPRHMQEKLCQKCWYERFNEKRILIREGQRATYFYFILSGSVVVTKKNPENGSSVLHILGRGDSFGEVALLTGSPREFTVTTKQETELLCMVDKDFCEMFLTQPDDPFLVTVPCLQGWPIQLIDHEKDKFVFGYFKKGTVLTRSSASSEWIFIIKSGSCSVMKKITPKIPGQMKPEAIKLPGESHVDMLQRLYRQHVLLASKQAKWMKIWSRPKLNIAMRDEDEELRKVKSTAFNLGGRTISIATIKESEQKALSRETTTMSRMASPSLPAGGPYLLKTGPREALNLAEDTKSLKIEREDVESRLSPIPFKLPQINRSKARRESRFAVIQTLVPRQHFGFTNELCEDQPDLALVSNGAEVLMIRRPVFFEMAPKALVQQIRDKTYPYPAEGKYHDLLEQHLLWQQERQLVLKNITKEIEERKQREYLVPLRGETRH